MAIDSNSPTNSSLYRNSNVFLNIPADGLEFEVIKNYDSPKEEYRENIKKYLEVYLKGTPVGTVLFNVFYRRSIVDSDTVDSMYYNIERDENLMPVMDENLNVKKYVSPDTDNTFLKGYRHAIRRGIDIVEMAISEAKKYGVTVFLSVRMNDHHDINDPGLNSSFSLNNLKETSIDGDGDRLDYCKESVRNYYKSFIIELCKKYDIDGIEVDFLRTCPIMSCVNEETTAMMTNWMQSVKEDALNESGKNLRFVARVYQNEKTNLGFGIDAADWVARGIVDTIVPEAWYIPTYYGIDASEWKKSINEKNADNNPYSIVPGTDWAVRCDSTNYEGYIMWITLEQFKGFVSSMYEKGADGIYIFNHFYTDSDMGSHTYYIDENGTKVCKNVLRSKMISSGSQESAEKGMRVYVNTCPEYYNALYPIAVSKSKDYLFSINTGSKPENGYFRVVVGIDYGEDYRENTLKVTINDSETKQLGDILPPPNFKWKKNDFFEPVASHISETCPRVMQFEATDLSCIKTGDNSIKIECTGKKQLIKWLEIHVENS